MIEIVEIPNEDVKVETHAHPLLIPNTTTDISEKGRLACIGIDQYLSRHLDAKKFENRLWFHSYLKDESFSSCNDNEVHAIAYLKFIRNVKRLSEEFISSNIWRSYKNQGGTHLVTDVQYGAEFVLWMHKQVDTSKESKELVERTIHLALENYLENKFFRCFPSFRMSIPHKALFDTMTCSFQSSIPNGCMSNGKFDQCIQKIQELIDIETNDRNNVWHPVGMDLCRIPTEEEIEKRIDYNQDLLLVMKQRGRWMTQHCNQLIESPYLHRVPFLKKPLLEFQQLLEPIASVINKTANLLETNYFSQSQFHNVVVPREVLITFAFEWLNRYHKDLEIMHSLLDGNSLPVLNLRRIKGPIKRKRGVKPTKVFALYFRCVTYNLVQRFKKWAECPSGEKGLKLFGFKGSFDTHWRTISNKFQVFLNEALNSVDNDVDYAVGILSPESPYKEGAVFTIRNEKVLRAANCTPSDVPLPTTLHVASAEGSKDTEQDSDLNMT